MDSDRVGMPDWQQPPSHILRLLNSALRLLLAYRLSSPKVPMTLTNCLLGRISGRTKLKQTGCIYMVKICPVHGGRAFSQTVFQFTVDFEFMHLWNMKAVAICWLQDIVSRTGTCDTNDTFSTSKFLCIVNFICLCAAGWSENLRSYLTVLITLIDVKSGLQEPAMCIQPVSLHILVLRCRVA